MRKAAHSITRQASTETTESSTIIAESSDSVTTDRPGSNRTGKPKGKARLALYRHLLSFQTFNCSQSSGIYHLSAHCNTSRFNFTAILQSTSTPISRRPQLDLLPLRSKPTKILDLTAVKEEIVIENQAALTANGFIVDVDESGDEPVGRRCKLLSLPMTKETTFSLTDLEELIALLDDSPHSTSNFTTQPPTSPNTSPSTQRQKHIPRPSRTRRLFASRACRSSIMIGKMLQKRQIQALPSDDRESCIIWAPDRTTSVVVHDRWARNQAHWHLSPADFQKLLDDAFDGE
ncbi:hypothetical protein Q9189_003564 [Teloschistes chrysophthalmus]